MWEKARKNYCLSIQRWRLGMGRQVPLFGKMAEIKTKVKQNKKPTKRGVICPRCKLENCQCETAADHAWQDYMNDIQPSTEDCKERR